MKRRDLVLIPPTVSLEATPVMHTLILLPLPASPVVDAAIPGQYVSELGAVSAAAPGSKTTVLQGVRER